MKANFHENLEEAAVELPSERSTGLVLSCAAIVAALIWRQHTAAFAACLATAAGLALVSLAAPNRLHQLNRAWMGLGQLMGKVMSPIVMLVLFCTTIVPFGLAMQLKRDPLKRRASEAEETFWVKPEGGAASDMTRQF